MSDVVYGLTNGILNWPGSSKNWNGRGVTWLHNHDTECQAEKIEYFCGIVGRAFGQNDRVLKLYRTFTFYKSRRIIQIAHSNGCAVLLDALREHDDFPLVDTIHLVCAASDGDFEKNGLNKLLTDGRVGNVFVYMAAKDEALRGADTIIGSILGYGHLGLDGPSNISAAVSSRIKVINAAPWDNYGHSDCWHDDNFDNTMANFVV